MRGGIHAEWGLVGVLVALAGGGSFGCGGEEKAPFVVGGGPGTTEGGMSGTDAGQGMPGGEGGAGGGGGGSGGDGGSGGADGGASGSGGAGGGGGQVVLDTPDCLLDPEKVYFAGTLNPNPSWYAVTEARAGARVCLGYRHSEGVVRPSDGRLIYFSRDDYRLHAFVGDAPVAREMGEGWTYPEDSEANDLPVDTSQCDDALSDGVGDYHVDPADGSIVFRCRIGPNQLTYFRSGAGNTPAVGDGVRLLALGYDGLMLADYTPLNDGPTVIDGAQEYPVSGLEVSDLGEVRAHEGGFWYVPLDSGDTLTRYTIDATGNVTSDLVADLPAGLHGGPNSGLGIAGDGSVFEIVGEDSGAYTVIVRRPVGGEATVVYSDEDFDGTQDWSSTPPNLFAEFHSTAFDLSTGP